MNQKNNKYNHKKRKNDLAKYEISNLQELDGIVFNDDSCYMYDYQYYANDSFQKVNIVEINNK